jgi:nitrogenase molybdenum-iron protein beta chain
MGRVNGGQSGVGFHQGAIPCSNLVESDTVFGGEEKLRKIVRDSLAYFDADMIMVFSGCTSNIIGDDISGAANDFADARIPVLAADTPGFGGNNIFGHDQVLKALAEQYLHPAPARNPRQVNVWGVIPYFDPFWAGVYDEIEKLLLSVGLEPNIIYGRGRGIAAVDRIPAAAFNLVLSPWWDVEFAKLLQERFGTPYFHHPVLPIGPTETKKFLDALRGFANLDAALVEDAVKRGEDEYYYYIARAAQFLYYGRTIPKNFIMVANSLYTLSVARFLVNDFGMTPYALYVVDDPPEGTETIFGHALSDLDGGVPAEIEIARDPGGIPAALRKKRERDLLLGGLSGPNFLFGSAWDLDLARENGSFYIPISAPRGGAVLNKSYFGYSGGLRLLEDILGAMPNS